jgi:crotonobetaine/carnitine-CoA ligase
MTVGELAGCSRRWASVLADEGLEKGDRVAFVCRNSEDYVALQFGTYMLGAVEVPINPELRGEMLRTLLADADPALVVVDEELTEGLSGVCPVGAGIVVLDRELAQRVDLAAPLTEPATPGLADLALILYTSGTTGPSKGVMLPHGYLPNTAATWISTVDVSADDTIYFSTPFAHVDAHVINAICLLSGATLGFAERFSVSRFWSEADELGATLFLAVGSMTAALAARRPPDPPDHRFRAGIVAPITPEVFDYFEDQLGIPLLQLYGQTEADGVVFNTIERRSRGGAGWACCGFDVRIADEDDSTVPIGVSGRLLYRPREPHMMTVGYWRRPDATADATRNMWWHTGDLAHVDEEGVLWFDGRASDSLRRRGENISAWELETAVMAAPGVRSAAAIAVSDEIGGEDEIKIFLSLEDEAEWDPRSFFDFCAQNLPRFAQPRMIQVIEEADFVRGPGTGAIQKHRLSRDRGAGSIDRTEFVE